MKTINSLIFIIIFSTVLTSCSSDINDYSNTTPVFKLEQFFNGKVSGYGLVTGFNDEVVRRFVVDIEAKWNGNEGVLDEYFVYDDGEKQFRQWRITKTSDNSYVGKADDIIGEATGEQSGSVLIWQYSMMLPVDGDTYEVSFDDTMALIDDKRMLNSAKIYKFGLNVANVILFFEKH